MKYWNPSDFIHSLRTFKILCRNSVFLFYSFVSKILRLTSQPSSHMSYSCYFLLYIFSYYCYILLVRLIDSLLYFFQIFLRLLLNFFITVCCQESLLMLPSHSIQFHTNTLKHSLSSIIQCHRFLFELSVLYFSFPQKKLTTSFL